MKQKGKKIAVRLAILVFVSFLFCALSACGESGSPPEEEEDNITNPVVVSSIGLVADHDSINPGDEVLITAIAFDSTGHVIPGKEISFALDDPTLASISESGTTAADGTFQAIFLARDSVGKVNVTASCDKVASTPKTITIMSQSVAVTIALSANPTSITATNTATITATVTKTEDGMPVENGTAVTFSLENSAFGTITESSTTNAGKATTTFTANNSPGIATINASSGSAKATANVTIEPTMAASIEFGSVSKNPIAIKGSGGQEYSNITFNVKDINGNPAEDIDVVFTMVSGIEGAEYLEENDDTPYTHTVSTTNGKAEITLHSGDEAGTVSVTASITTPGGDIISSTTPVISIGGGVPTDNWFTISVEDGGWNLGGLNCEGIEAGITAWLADRYGNYNVLDGHNVFFETETGLAVSPIGVTSGAKGTADSIVRTQSVPKDVVPETWEETLKKDLNTKYGISLPGNPRDGVCSVLIFTKGEESFADGSNGGKVDGLYNLGEWFTDTIDDPWRDYDDDRLWDSGLETTPLTDPAAIGFNPMEDGYQDSAGNDQWDGINGVWDGNKNLSRQVEFLITGTPYVLANRGSFQVPNGGFDIVHILICDQNYNPLSAGSTYTVSVDAGKITGGTTSYVYPSSSFFGSRAAVDPDSDDAARNAVYTQAHRELLENEIVISDNDPTKLETKMAGLTITVTWKSNGGCADVVEKLTIFGIIDYIAPE